MLRNEVIYCALEKEIKEDGENWIPILKVGYVPSKDKEFTREDLQNILVSFSEKALGENIEIPIVITHSGIEAMGWIKDLKLDGDYLYALIEWNENGKKMIKEKSFRYLSPELIYNVKGFNKKDYPLALFRVALTNTPALDLPSVNFEVIYPYGSYTYSSYTEEEKEKLLKDREKRVEKYKIKPRGDGHLTPPKEYSENGATSPEDYADPVNYKYPINTSEYASSALRYFSKPENHNIYSPEERDIIWERIIKACLKFKITVNYNPNYHSNLPESLKKKMEGYKVEEESSMEEKDKEILELENKIKEKEQENLELERKIKELTEKIVIWEKEKSDKEWAEKVKYLLDNGYILPSMEKDLLEVDESVRDTVYKCFSKTKLIELENVKEFKQYVEVNDDLEIKKAIEETKALLNKGG